MTTLEEKLAGVAGVLDAWDKRVRLFDSGMYGSSTREIYRTIRLCADEIREVLYP